jgi:pimeloyl-ACP methyl ester carboxylesterase
VAAAAANLDFPNPVLVAWGDDSRLFPRRLGQRPASELLHARLVTINDCAAFAALDQPQQLADLISSRLNAGPAR